MYDKYVLIMFLEAFHSKVDKIDIIFQIGNATQTQNAKPYQNVQKLTANARMECVSLDLAGKLLEWLGSVRQNYRSGHMPGKKVVTSSSMEVVLATRTGLIPRRCVRKLVRNKVNMW